MAKYRIKVIQVDAISTTDAIAQAKSDWLALPVWLKRAYKNGHILFGYAEISVSTKSYIKCASLNDTIVCYEDGSLEVMSNTDFANLYELINNTREVPSSIHHPRATMMRGDSITMMRAKDDR